MKRKERFQSIRLRKFVTSGNTLSRMDDLEARAHTEFMRGVKATKLSDFSDDLGVVTAGSFISPASTATSTEPTDSGFTGAAMGGDGWTFNSVVYHFVAVAAGVLQAGFNAAGQLLGGAGAWVLDALGLTITGVDFVEVHNATVGANARRMRRGYQNISGSPAYLVEVYDSADGANLITVNSDFETGSLATGYSASTNWAIATDDKHGGTYSAKIEHDKTNPLTTNKYATTAGNSYTARYYVTSNHASGTFTGQVLWYDAGTVLVKTDTISANTNNKYQWWARSITLVAPATSTQCEIKLYFSSAGTAGFYTWVDDLYLAAVSQYSAVRMDDTGVYAITELVTNNLLGTPQSVFVSADQCVTSVTRTKTQSRTQQYGFYLAPSAANANDGDEYLYQFALAAGIYTMTVLGATGSGFGIVDYYLDGAALAFVGGIDWYSAVLTENVEMTQSVTISIGGRHTLKIKVNGKNAGSSDYRFANTAIWFVPATFTVAA